MNTWSILNVIILPLVVTFLSVVSLIALRTSRRAVKWNEERTAEAVPPAVDEAFKRFGRQ